MATTWTEKWGQRLTATRAELGYVGIPDSGDDIGDAYASLASTAPSTFEGLARSDLDVKEVEGGDCYIGIVPYSNSDFSFGQLQPADPAEYEFDISGVTQHITQSIRTRGAYVPVGSTAAPLTGLIGFSKEGVEGTDILIPVSTFTYSRAFAPATIDATYVDTLEQLVATTNNATFAGRAAGEVLFIGANGRQRGDENWFLTYRFARSKNKTNFIINPADDAAHQITVVSKKGHEYLWVRWEDVADTAGSAPSQRIIKRAIEARVEQVYEEGDFSLMGLGV